MTRPPASLNHYFQEFTQDSFSTFDFNESGLNLHRHPNRSRREIAVFIHGFNGTGYKTWREFPRYLFDGTADGTSIDVGIFRYNTGFLAAAKRNVNLSLTAERLAAALREITSTYDSIYLICHSLGGLVAQAAVEIFLDDHTYREKSFSTNIAGLFFFGSPRAGTRFAPQTLNRLLREFRWLGEFSERVTSTEKFFTNNVESAAVANPGSKPFLIPRYVCMGNGDAVVEEFSTTYGIPKDRIFYPDLDHGEIAKPTTNDAPQLIWLCRERRRIEELRGQWLLERAYAAKQSVQDTEFQALFVTELWTELEGSTWEELYNDARQTVSREYSHHPGKVLIRDKRELVDTAARVDLLISIHNAERVIGMPDLERPVLAEAQRRHQNESSLTVAISPVGDRTEEASKLLESWLVPHRPYQRFYIETAADSGSLQKLLRRWLKLLITTTELSAAPENFSQAESILGPPAPYRRYFNEGGYR